MDPDTAWSDLALAHREQRWDDCSEPAAALADWIESGGFIPADLERQNFLGRTTLIAWLRTYARPTAPRMESTQ